MAELREVVDNFLLQKLGKGRTPFWGAYTKLNKSMNIPTIPEIKTFQMNKIKQLEQASINSQRDKGKNIDEINELFKGNINSLIQENTKNQQIELDKTITRIVETIGEFRDYTKYQKGKKQEYEKAQQSLISLSQQLEFLMKKVNIQSPIFKKDLDQLNNLIKNNSLKSFNQSIMKQWIHNLNTIQGEVIEELGVSWLNEKIPQDLKIKALSTGKLNLQNTTRSNRHAGQLIQDIMILNMDNVDLLKDVNINYKIGNKNFTTSLDKFLEMIENNESSKQIVIDDYVYDILTQLSLLNIQAKSGLKQRLFNQNKATQVSIKEFSEDDNRNLSVLHTFKLLKALQDEQPKKYKKKKWLAINHNAYDALANYGLGTRLDKVLSLKGEEGNQYLLTPSGFTSYTERIKQMYDKSQGIFKFSNSILLNDSVLDQMRSVSLTTNLKT